MKQVALALLALLAFVATPVNAVASPAKPLTQVAVCGNGVGDFFGFQPWYACLPKNPDGSPKLTKLTDIYLVIFPVVDWILKAAVFVAAGFIFLMLFKIATSRGNSSQYSTALSGVRDAIIGLVIAVMSVAILNFVAGAFY